MNATTASRAVPDDSDLEGMSIGGARLAWTSAGFVGTFTTTDADTDTVDPDSIIISPLVPECAGTLAIFNATIEVALWPQTQARPAVRSCPISSV